MQALEERSEQLVKRKRKRRAGHVVLDKTAQLRPEAFQSPRPRLGVDAVRFKQLSCFGDDVGDVPDKRVELRLDLQGPPRPGGMEYFREVVCAEDGVVLAQELDGKGLHPSAV